MDAAPKATDHLPPPFYDDGWPRKTAPAARALWHWHLRLAHPAAASGGAAFFEEERRRAEAAEPLRLLPDAVTEAAYAACRAHGLPRTLLADQVAASARWLGPLRFDAYAALDAFVGQWAGAHARLLARLAGLSASWQTRHVDELARAFFLTARLARLPDDLARDRLFVPLDEVAQAGVTLDDLRAGTISPAVRKLLWKQAVRARDAFAQALPLAGDLPRGRRRAFKRGWLGGLEVLNEIERRGFDVWTRPVTLSAVQRFRVRLQALVGKTAFR